MKKLITLIILLNISYSAQLLAQEDIKQLTQKSRQAIKELKMQLNHAVQTEMKKGKKADVVSACQEKAPIISLKVSDKNAVLVNRTALKYRNKMNKPDVWEKTILEQFEQRKAKGEPIKTIEQAEITQLDGEKVFRYMKAIPVGKGCLACHGENISPKMTKKIKTAYKNDKAIGFKKGDIRGAFTVIQPLQ